jgi:uncharacterized membrane protein YphA (DoxX/SURF4 family)
MKPAELLLARLILAAIWLYQGLWLKIIQADPHHLTVVRSVPLPVWITPDKALTLIGAGETLLALGIASGLWHRLVNGFQIALLVAMNIIGIVCAGSEISAGWGLLLMNLPQLMLAWLLLRHGPGKWNAR